MGTRPTPLTSSFRDPAGFVFRQDGTLYRQVNQVFRDSYDAVVDSGLYPSLMQDGLLVRHEEVDPRAVGVGPEAYRVLRPEPVPFISYPYEWCFGQLRDAALLTLEVLRRALERGLWLKDASAFNVQFLRGRPVLVDSLSFEPLPEGKPWVAYQQFVRHFLAPLALIAYRGPELGKLSRVELDGVPLDLASRLLPWRTRLRFSLFTHVHLHARMVRAHAGRADERVRSARMGRNALAGLAANLEAAVRRLEWTPEGTPWVDYYAETNYSPAAMEHKRRAVARAIERARPASVWDLGANVGRFALIPAQRGIPTVAFDTDPGAIELCYRKAREDGSETLLPLVMDLANPSTDLGWDHAERMSLAARGPADLVLALALVHHLALVHNVPLERLARFLRRLARTLLIEFVPKSDSQVERLLATRPDVFPEYSREGFEAAFLRHFELAERIELEDSERVLYLFDAGR